MAVTDLIIYSFNRPLQLYALLESVEKYMQGVGVERQLTCPVSDN